MIKLKGTTLYPPGIFELLNQIDGIIDYAVEVFTGELGTDELRLYLLADPQSQLETSEVLKSAFQSRLKVVPITMFIDQAQMERLQMVGKSRKVKRFIDSRR
jgi:phenylacetate-CoA ligase